MTFLGVRGVQSSASTRAPCNIILREVFALVVSSKASRQKNKTVNGKQCHRPVCVLNLAQPNTACWCAVCCMVVLSRIAIDVTIHMLD